MRYIALLLYVCGLVAVGQAWFAAVPLRLKFAIAGVGLVLVLIGALIQWFLVKKD